MNAIFTGNRSVAALVGALRPTYPYLTDSVYGQTFYVFVCVCTKSMCAFACVCRSVCVCVCVCVSVCVCSCVFMRAFVRVRVSIRAHVCVCLYFFFNVATKIKSPLPQINLYKATVLTSQFPSQPTQHFTQTSPNHVASFRVHVGSILIGGDP